MHRFDIGHDHFVRKICFIHISHNALEHAFRHVLINGRICLYCTVCVICNVIKRRHVDTPNFSSSPMKKILLSICTVFFHFNIQAGKFNKVFFALSNREAIKKFRNGLCIISTRASADYNWKLISPIPCIKRNRRQFKHFKSCGIAHLILQGNSDNIEICELVPAFVSAERNVVLTHFFLHINPRSIHSLTPHIGLLIKCSVKYSHTEIRHSNLIGVRKAECPSCLDILFILNYLTEFTRTVSAGFFN